MPTYCYHCKACNQRTEIVMTHIPPWVPQETNCVKCGKLARRDYSAGSMPMADFFRPYVTDNMGHDPVYVGSRKEEARLCKKRGIERVS